MGCDFEFAILDPTLTRILIVTCSDQVRLFVGMARKQDRVKSNAYDNLFFQEPYGIILALSFHGSVHSAGSMGMNPLNDLLHCLSLPQVSILLS